MPPMHVRTSVPPETRVPRDRQDLEDGQAPRDRQGGWPQQVPQVPPDGRARQDPPQSQDRRDPLVTRVRTGPSSSPPLQDPQDPQDCSRQPVRRVPQASLDGRG